MLERKSVCFYSSQYQGGRDPPLTFWSFSSLKKTSYIQLLASLLKSQTWCPTQNFWFFFPKKLITMPSTSFRNPQTINCPWLHIFLYCVQPKPSSPIPSVLVKSVLLSIVVGFSLLEHAVLYFHILLLNIYSGLYTGNKYLLSIHSMQGLRIGAWK